MGLILIFSLEFESLFVSLVILFILSVAGAELLWAVEEAMAFVGGAIFGVLISKGFFVFWYGGEIYSSYSISRFLNNLFSLSSVDIVLAILFGALAVIFHKFTIILITSSIGSFLLSLGLFNFDLFFLFLVFGVLVQYGTLSYFGHSVKVPVTNGDNVSEEKVNPLIKCPSCGAENKIDAAFCTNCKQILSQKPSQFLRDHAIQTASSTTSKEGYEKITCPSCETENQNDSSYCNKCGKIL